MKGYHWWLSKILHTGEKITDDRTGVGTLSIFGAELDFDLTHAFPLVTTRAIRFHSVVDELLWFISGSTNVNDLPDRTKPWWLPWADADGNLGPVYGKQLRDFNGVDQLQNVINSLKENPHSRRHLITLWNPADLDEMALPPCHGIVIQFYVRNNHYLDCKMYIRSNDWFLGTPTNIASYALLTHLVGQVCGYTAGRLIYTVGDAHLYLNHIQPAETLLARFPRELPQLIVNPEIFDIDQFKAEDIQLFGYRPYPHIPAKIAV